MTTRTWTVLLVASLASPLAAADSAVPGPPRAAKSADSAVPGPPRAAKSAGANGAGVEWSGIDLCAEPPQAAVPEPKPDSRMRDPFDDSRPAAGPPSKTLERAIKIYEAEDFTMASPELWKVVQRETGDDRPNRDRAAFFLGKALFQRKLYLASASCFRRSAEDAGDRYHGKTLQWLSSLSLHVPEESGVDGLLRRYRPEDAEHPLLEPVRADIQLMRALDALRDGNAAEALRWLSRVRGDGEAAVRAAFAEAVALTARATGDLDAAAEIVARARTWEPAPGREAEGQMVGALLALSRCDYGGAQKQLANYRSIVDKGIRWSAPAPPGSFAEEIERERKALEKSSTALVTGIERRVREDLDARAAHVARDEAKRRERDARLAQATAKLERLVETLIAEGAAGRLAAPVRAAQTCK